MERPVFKPVGTPVYELDTPALVVDLNILEQNIATLHSFFLKYEAKVRPYVSVHKCPAIAHKQMAAGGTAQGVSVSSLEQAEVFVGHGFGNIFVTNKIVLPQKISMLCTLALSARMAVSVDDAQNVKDLSDAAEAKSVILDVAVDINTRLGYCGVEPGQPAVELAKAVQLADSLRFVGLTTYEGRILSEDRREVISESRRWVQRVLDTREMIERSGIDVELVMVGGTHNYDVVGKMSGVTEVPAGTYALMDYEYLRYREEFRPAARMLTTVTSHPEPKVVIVDAGAKAVGVARGLPNVEGIPGVRVNTLHAEHGVLDAEGSAEETVRLGDKAWLIPRDIGVCANLNDYFRAIRNGKLEAMWDIPARGLYR